MSGADRDRVLEQRPGLGVRAHPQLKASHGQGPGAARSWGADRPSNASSLSSLMSPSAEAAQRGCELSQHRCQPLAGRGAQDRPAERQDADRRLVIDRCPRRTGTAPPAAATGRPAPSGRRCGASPSPGTTPRESCPSDIDSPSHDASRSPSSQLTVGSSSVPSPRPTTPTAAQTGRRVPRAHP